MVMSYLLGEEAAIRMYVLYSRVGFTALQDTFTKLFSQLLSIAIFPAAFQSCFPSCF